MLNAKKNIWRQTLEKCKIKDLERACRIQSLCSIWVFPVKSVKCLKIQLGNVFNINNVNTVFIGLNSSNYFLMLYMREDFQMYYRIGWKSCGIPSKN